MNQQKYFWQHYGEQKLLSLSFRELKLSLEAAPFRPWIDHYESELDSFGIRFRPHLWISEEWFSPDDVPGIAIPFYLCHTRLRALQRKYLFQVEGGSREEFLCIVRHEAGHAFETAFELSKEAQWRKIFGNPEKPYPARSYAPNPFSDHYVQNIKFWYAQSHPHEDFAETFAVCLRRGFNWRRRYRNAPIALRKLEYVESLLKELPRRKAKNVSRRKIDPSSRSALTLRAYYDREREQYALDEGSSMDGTLLRLFHREKEREGVRASAFLRKNRSQLRQTVGSWTNANPILVEYILEELTDRAAEMNLYLKTSTHETLLATLCMLTYEVALLSTTKRGIRIPF